MKNKNKATLIGLIAILLWSSLVGTIRVVCENLGAIGGTAMIYSVAAILLLFTVGLTKIRDFLIRYLLWGTLLFVSYELCFSLSIGYANSERQAIEVSLLNYLWPTLTIVFAILFNHHKANLLIIPGIILPIFGIAWVLGGEQSLKISSILNNIKDNPFSYTLAISGSIIWAAYCIVTVKFANGKNGITLFFMLTAITLWIKYITSNQEAMTFNYSTLFYLALSAFAIGFGYATWNFGMLYGNVTILAGASYFIPIFSVALSAVILKTSLSFTFWQGTSMVCFGAILCWLATRKH